MLNLNNPAKESQIPPALVAPPDVLVGGQLLSQIRGGNVFLIRNESI